MLSYRPSGGLEQGADGLEDRKVHLPLIDHLRNFTESSLKNHHFWIDLTDDMTVITLRLPSAVVPYGARLFLTSSSKP